MIFTLAVTQAFPTMLCHLKCGLFILFGAFVLIMSGIVYYFLPETKGTPIDEVNEVWKLHWYWSRFFTPGDFPIRVRDIDRTTRI